jgi:phosphohistidine swiveling domain-containing protein
MMHVRMRREPSNHVDSNAVLIVNKNGNILGHLERKVAAVLARGCLTSYPSKGN